MSINIINENCNTKTNQIIEIKLLNWILDFDLLTIRNGIINGNGSF